MCYGSIMKLDKKWLKNEVMVTLTDNRLLKHFLKSYL